MLPQITSFLRESSKLYVLYMTAGVAAIPAGTLYALLAVKGYDHWWTAVPAIILGLWSARKAWKFVDRGIFMMGYNPTASAYSNVAVIGAMQTEAAVLISCHHVSNGPVTAGLGSTATAMEDIEPSNQGAIESHACA
jgi:hypothetical protein